MIDIVTAIEDAGFEGSLVPSNQQDKLLLRVDCVLNELDAHVLEGIILARLNGVRQFRLDRIVEVVFDPEVVSSRSLVDGIEGGCVSGLESVFLIQIPLFFIQEMCPHIALFDTVLVWRCGPFMIGDWLKWALISVIQFVLGMESSSKWFNQHGCVLVALGTSASSYFDSVGALLYGAGKTSDAMKKLVQLTPATAILIEGEGRTRIGETEIDALLIQPGDSLKVLPGGIIPADGVVVLLTCMVFFHTKATKVGSDAVLSQIISLVETAQMSKAPIQKFADYAASIFVPVVIALALFTLVGWSSIGGAVGAYPEEWLPEKGTHFVFSLMFSISVVGPCLTQGKATVATAKVFAEMDRGEFLTLVASAEANSEHPLAKAIVEYSRHFHFFDESAEDGETNKKETQNSGWLLGTSDFSALPLQGIQCLVNNKLIMF
ncbi:hypothetical protein Bca101_050733 [Brassica carinata]